MSFLKRIDRIWVTAVVLLVIAGWMAMIFHIREYAIFKSNVREYFLNDNEKTGDSIKVLLDDRLLRVFGLYTAVLIALTPLILHKFVKQLWVGLIAVGILFLPSCWYGHQVNYVAGKFVDWTALRPAFENEPVENDGDSEAEPAGHLEK